MILDLDLGKRNYFDMRRLVFSELEKEAPNSILGDLKDVIGEVLSNCKKHGKDENVLIRFGYDIASFAFVVTVTAESHFEHRKRISKLLFDSHLRRCCGLLMTHGRGLDMVTCLADKVILDDDGNLRLYFACILPDFDFSRDPLLDRGIRF